MKYYCFEIFDKISLFIWKMHWLNGKMMILILSIEIWQKSKKFNSKI